MNIEADIFKKSRFIYDKVLKYGFIKEKDIYTLKTNILNNAFRVELIIKNDTLSGKIYDLEFNEEYINYRIKNNNGKFVSVVREEYIKLLEDIRNNCCYSEPFIYPQTNRINKYIYDKYKDNPEFLFDDDETGVYRNKSSNKWYGIIMNINKKKFDLDDKDIEVMNIKLDPLEIEELIKNDGFYKAYHMNKKYWISIILDDTINDEIIYKLIDKSYVLVSK